jgi:hypothetical protein
MGREKNIDSKTSSQTTLIVGQAPFSDHVVKEKSITDALNIQPIRFRTFLRNTVYDCMRDRGWKETDSETEWDFYWADVHWVHDAFDHIYLHENQRINHFRNHYEV